MSLRFCLTSIPRTRQFAVSYNIRPGSQTTAAKNAFRTIPYTNSNGRTSGAQYAKFSSTPVAQNSRPVLAGTRRLYKLGGVASLGLGLAISSYATQPILCESPPAPVNHASSPPPLPPPPQSAVNVYELSFGTVCGFCAGIFVKKGAKLVAFVFGGVFVLLQYFASLSLVRTDWGRMASRFENLFYTVDAQGVKRAPNVGSLLRWVIDFLTADFQQRASFIAGFILGLRLG